MTTFNDLIEQVQGKLAAETEDTEVLGTLGAPITATDMTFTFEGPTLPGGVALSPGLVEVGEELVYVQDVDADTGVATGVLRGQRGTTAVDHPAGTPVRDNPRWSRVSVKQAINDALVSLYPRVYAVKEVVADVDMSTGFVTLPADCHGVLAVEASNSWRPEPVRVWSFTRYGATPRLTVQAFTHQVRVTYKAEAGEFTSLSETFTAATGLPEYCREAVVYGACFRLTIGGDAARIAQRTAAQARLNQQGVQVSWAQLAKMFAAAEETAIGKAEARLVRDVPVSQHWEV